jgi:hypothetical protein
VDLLNLGVFGGENLEWSCFFGSGAAWSSPKYALSQDRWSFGLALSASFFESSRSWNKDF